MSDRKLPFSGLSGYWPPGTPGWTIENQQNLRMLAQIGQLNLASRAVLPAAFDPKKMYLVPAGQPNAGQIAVYDAGWFFMVPEVGWNISVADELSGGLPSWFNWTGAVWAPGKTAGGSGAAYDDTAIKARLDSVEQTNVTQTNQIGALQLFQGQMIVPWGDSRSAQNWNTNTVPAAPLARSWLWWFELLSQRVRMDVDYMQGVSGDRMVDLLNRIQQDLPAGGGYGTKKPSEVPPCIAALMCWTNSVNQGTPLADLVLQTNAVLDYLLARGHKVILIAEWPRGAQGSADGALTADNQKLLLATHNALLKIRRKDVFIVDVWPRVADPASANAYPLANMLNPDNLHNSPGVSMITGQEMARVAIDEMQLPRMKLTAASNTDQFDATLQPQGCLNTNPMMITPGGGVTGPAATGVAPLGYTLSTNNAGLTAVGSFVTTTLPDGSKRKAFRVVVSGTPTATNTYVSIRQSGLLSKLALNDIIEANYEVNVADGHVNFGAPGLVLDTATNATRAHGGLSLSGDNMAPVEAVRPFYGVPRSADLIVSALPTSLSFDMRLYFTLANVASSLTIDILSSAVRKKKQ